MFRTEGGTVGDEIYHFSTFKREFMDHDVAYLTRKTSRPRKDGKALLILEKRREKLFESLHTLALNLAQNEEL